MNCCTLGVLLHISERWFVTTLRLISPLHHQTLLFGANRRCASVIARAQPQASAPSSSPNARTSSLIALPPPSGPAGCCSCRSSLFLSFQPRYPANRDSPCGSTPAAELAPALRAGRMFCSSPSATSLFGMLKPTRLRYAACRADLHRRRMSFQTAAGMLLCNGVRRRSSAYCPQVIHPRHRCSFHPGCDATVPLVKNSTLIRRPQRKRCRSAGAGDACRWHLVHQVATNTGTLPPSNKSLSGTTTAARPPWGAGVSTICRMLPAVCCWSRTSAYVETAALPYGGCGDDTPAVNSRRRCPACRPDDGAAVVEVAFTSQQTVHQRCDDGCPGTSSRPTVLIWKILSVAIKVIQT